MNSTIEGYVEPQNINWDKVQLVEGIESGVIVLTSPDDQTNGSFTGTVVFTKDEFVDEIGDLSSDWNKNKFRVVPNKMIIQLQND